MSAAHTSLRIVIDTNTLLRGLLTESSAAAKIRRAAENRLITPLLSKSVLDEYRAVLSDRKLVERFPELTPELIEITTRRLRFEPLRKLVTVTYFPEIGDCH